MTAHAFDTFPRLHPVPEAYLERESIPYEGQTRMRLTITSGLSDARIRIDPDAKDLIAIEYDGDVPPDLRASSSELRLSWPATVWSWLTAVILGEQREIEIVLHPAVEWAVQVRGGISHFEADLAAGKLARLDISGGVSDARVDLPAPRGLVPIRIAGGVSELHVCRPAGAGVTLEVAGGVSKLRLDDQTFDAIGGGARLLAGPREHEGARYTLEVSGGASGLQIAHRAADAVAQYKMRVRMLVSSAAMSSRTSRETSWSRSMIR